MNKLEGVNKVLRASGRLPAPALDTGGSSWAGIAERIIDIEDLQIQTRAWHYNDRKNVTVSPVLYTFDNAAWTDATKTLTQAGKFSDATVGQTISVAGTGVSATEAVVTGVDTSAGAYVTLDRDISTGGDIASGISGAAQNNRIAVPDGTLTIDADTDYETRNITQTGGRLYNLDDNTSMFSDSVIVRHSVRYTFNCLPLPIRDLIIAKSILEFVRTHGPKENIGWAEREVSRMELEARRWDTRMIDHNVFRTRGARAMFGDRSTTPAVFDV